MRKIAVIFVILLLIFIPVAFADPFTDWFRGLFNNWLGITGKVTADQVSWKTGISSCSSIGCKAVSDMDCSLCRAKFGVDKPCLDNDQTYGPAFYKYGSGGDCKKGSADASRAWGNWYKACDCSTSTTTVQPATPVIQPSISASSGNIVWKNNINSCSSIGCKAVSDMDCALCKQKYGTDKICETNDLSYGPAYYEGYACKAGSADASRNWGNWYKACDCSSGGTVTPPCTEVACTTSDNCPGKKKCVNGVLSSVCTKNDPNCPTPVPTCTPSCSSCSYSNTCANSGTQSCTRSDCSTYTQTCGIRNTDGISCSGGTCSNGQCLNVTASVILSSNPCDGVVCNDYCSGYTRYYNGVCVGGGCNYTRQENSSICGWQQPSNVNFNNNKTCSTSLDGVCPITCSVGVDADCCKNSGKFFLKTSFGYGCYSSDYNPGCYGNEACGSQIDGCCPNWCAAGSDADCCINLGKDFVINNLGYYNCVDNQQTVTTQQASTAQQTVSVQTPQQGVAQTGKTKEVTTTALSGGGSTGPPVTYGFCFLCGRHEMPWTSNRPGGALYIAGPSFSVPTYRADVITFANENKISVGEVARLMSEITMCSDCHFGGTMTAGCNRCQLAIKKAWNDANKPISER